MKQEIAKASMKYLRGQCFCGSVQFELAEMEAIAHVSLRMEFQKQTWINLAWPLKR